LGFASIERSNVEREEPGILWQDTYVACISQGPGWNCAVSRNVDQDRAIYNDYQRLNHHDVHDIVNSGEREHLAHYVIKKWKDDKEFKLAASIEYAFGIAHRLDVDTSGCLLIAKNVDGMNLLREAFDKHTMFKEYICLCHGLVKNTTAEVEDPIATDENKNVSYISKEKGKWAKSIYTVMGRYRLNGQKGGKRGVFTLCRVRIITGRRHQIRVHMASIGHPLVSDSKYNDALYKADTLWCPRIFLHAWHVGFNDYNRQWKEVKAPLAKDLSRALRMLDEIRIDPESLKNDAPSYRLMPATKVRNQENLPLNNLSKTAWEAEWPALSEVSTVPSSTVYGKKNSTASAGYPQEEDNWSEGECNTSVGSGSSDESEPVLHEKPFLSFHTTVTLCVSDYVELGRLHPSFPLRQKLLHWAPAILQETGIQLTLAGSDEDLEILLSVHNSRAGRLELEQALELAKDLISSVTTDLYEQWEAEKTERKHEEAEKLESHLEEAEEAEKTCEAEEGQRVIHRCSGPLSGSSGMSAVF